MSFANNLKRELDSKGWKAVHLCAALSDIGEDCHVLTVQRYIDGEREPRVSMVQAIARALDIHASVLLCESEPSPTAAEG